MPFLAEPWGFPLARWQKAIPTTKSGFYRVFLGPFDYLIPKSSQAVTAVMSQPYVFEKPAAVRDGLVVSLGVGLVAAEGEQHKVRKKKFGVFSWPTYAFLEAEEAPDAYLRPEPQSPPGSSDVG